MFPQKNRPLLMLFLFFTLSLLSLIVFYQQSKLATQNKERDQTDQERILLIGGTIKRAMQIDSKLRNDPYTLHLLAEEIGVKQIRLIEGNGKLLVDSTREIHPNETVPLSLSLHKASEGKEAILIVPEKGKRSGELFLPLQEGSQSPVIHLLLDLPQPIKNANTEILLLLIKLFFWVGGGVLGYYIVRPFWASEKPVVVKEGMLDNAVQDAVHKLKQMKETAQADADIMRTYNENIIQSMPSGLVTFDCHEKITTVNPTAEAILGLRRELVLHQDFKVLFGIHSGILSLLEEAFSQKTEITRTECELTQHDGKKIWLGLTSSILRDQKGERIGSSLFFVDITERKSTQEQSDLSKRLAMMGEISAWIAHEFRNYMGTIMGYTSLLSKEFERASPSYEMTRSITHELTTMERLITELLAYGKRPALILQRVPFVPLVEGILDSFKAGSPDVQFKTAFELCEASIDTVLMRQAISNLIRNGIEAMKEGGREAMLGIRIGHLRDGSVEMSVSDTGRGIPADQQEKIFLPFFTTREKGSGLGLALVHKIILSHKGTISVASKEGEGTTFTITLPRI